MSKMTGFFILESDCCSNLPGLLKYLGDLIYNQHTCIVCERVFKSAKACQNHMVDKQHTFMRQDDFGQYESFYDFREYNIKAAERLQEKYKHLKPDDSNTLIYAIEGDKGVFKKEEDLKADDEGSWEDMSEDDKKEEPKTKEISKPETKKLYRLRKAKITSTGELLLPNGKLVGHRDFVRYYKQSGKELKEKKDLYRDERMEISNMRAQQWLVAKIKDDANSKNANMMLRQYKSLVRSLKIKNDKINLPRKKYEKKKWLQLGQNTFIKYFVDRNVVFG